VTAATVASWQWPNHWAMTPGRAPALYQLLLIGSSMMLRRHSRGASATQRFTCLISRTASALLAGVIFSCCSFSAASHPSIRFSGYARPLST
jgi:hypothetical protein